jgi:hypothetical protein
MNNVATMGSSPFNRSDLPQEWLEKTLADPDFQSEVELHLESALGRGAATYRRAVEDQVLSEWWDIEVACRLDAQHGAAVGMAWIFEGNGS